jgi:hypothetical protein
MLSTAFTILHWFKLVPNPFLSVLLLGYTWAVFLDATVARHQFFVAMILFWAGVAFGLVATGFFLYETINILKTNIRRKNEGIR